MKLRIRGNSIRLRLTQSEARRVGEGGRVEESIGFASGARLVYAVEPSPQVTELAAEYRANEIVVRVPRDLAERWAQDGEMISLDGVQRIEATNGARQGGASSQDDENVLRLLVEKDFACLTEARGADDADTFPHPMAGTMKC